MCPDRPGIVAAVSEFVYAGGGNIIHADQHGAVVIPEAVIYKIPAAVDLLQRKEAVILDMAKAPGFTFEKLAEALRKQDEIH